MLPFVCIAFPSRRLFFEDQPPTPGESRCGQLEAPIKNDHQKKSPARCNVGRGTVGIRVVLVCELQRTRSTGIVGSGTWS